MTRIALAGSLAALLLVAGGRISAQESPRDTAEIASAPIVVQRDFFSLTLDVGVFIERVCISVEPLSSVCEDILVLLQEHGVRSDLAEEIRREMQELLQQDLIEAMEEWIRQEIGSEIEEQKRLREASVPQ